MERAGERVLAWAVAVAAAVVLWRVGIQQGTFVAADSDPYGYVSQAELIAHGTLRIDQAFARSMPWPFPEWSFSPPAYRPAPGGFIVPNYPPGLPLVMAAFQRAKGRNAVFYVVPMLGAFAVLMTAGLGARLHSPLAGALAAVLLASSPSVLYQVLQPVSDVPAMAWWTASLVLATEGGAVAAALAGGAASMAILTRPNLVPLGAVIGLFLIWRAVRGPAEGRRAARGRVALFALGAVPGCLAVALVNRYLYGSPLQSGYGDLGPLYSLANLVANLDRYPRWILETQSPFVCLAVLAPWIVARASGDPSAQRVCAGRIWLALAFVAAVFLSYLFYVPWERGNWGYVRFLLPAYPPLLVLSVASALEGARRLIPRRQAATAATLVVCALLAAWQVRTAIDRGVFAIGLVERRYADVGRFVASVMPPEAVFISGAEAGSVRYYSNRLTIRFDLLSPRWLDIAVRTLREKGYRPYILLEEAEEQPFRDRFKALNVLAALDWPPMAARYEPIRVRIYDPDDRPRFLAGQGIVTGDMNLVKSPEITVKQD